MRLPTFFSTRAHVLACTGPRCRRRGGVEVFERTWEAMEARRLAYYARGGTVRLTETGCQGACQHGPNAIAYYATGAGTLAEAWYAGTTTERLLALVEALHGDRPLPTRGRYDPGRPLEADDADAPERSARARRQGRESG
ncbi:MAG TPA: (2Fe-2S) ferredoxin domain-containing protein [Sandaracinaceae bacterium LLY-WYZ-13_1]|nr:(2Fe-2S) ferredoxin domain-containing protein [Sandaracinaceae bacterium LLY-WYZ-13_1]